MTHKQSNPLPDKGFCQAPTNPGGLPRFKIHMVGWRTWWQIPAPNKTQHAHHSLES